MTQLSTSPSSSTQAVERPRLRGSAMKAIESVWFLVAAVLVALALAGTSDYDEGKRQEDWNCKNFPTAFDYCDDVLRADK